MNRNFFVTTTDANKAAIDSLENAFTATYQTQINDTGTFNRSVAFGKAVAQLIFDWSKADGASSANAAYGPPVGPGLWVPTPPANAAPFGPYWGNNRLLFPNSLNGSAPQAPPAYSTDTASEYYKMMKEVYDVSQALTPEQTAIGLYYRDNPGFGGGHYLSLIRQIVSQQNRSLDFSAYLYAKAGIAVVDAAIGTFKSKYQYNQERPITYIRNVLGYSSWNALFATPNFPDFPSAHSVISGAFAEVLKKDLGNNYQFTNHAYDYLGMAPRTYSSLDAMATEIGLSRLYAGIHNRIAIDRGTTMGNKIGQNINNGVKFLK
ncbi:vanadium-dependent haloperoxidase [Spirosoma areae]